MNFLEAWKAAANGEVVQRADAPYRLIVVPNDDLADDLGTPQVFSRSGNRVQLSAYDLETEWRIFTAHQPTLDFDGVRAGVKQGKSYRRLAWESFYAKAYPKAMLTADDIDATDWVEVAK